MQQLFAIIRPFLAEHVLRALEDSPIEALIVRDVMGHGRQKSYLDQYSETEFSEAFLPKVEIMIWVDDSRVEEVIQTLIRLARTGRIGDGKILAVPVERSISV